MLVYTDVGLFVRYGYRERTINKRNELYIKYYNNK